MNSVQVAAALRILANAFEAPEGEGQPAAEPQKRGRGRPVKGEDSAATSTSAGATNSNAPAQAANQSTTGAAAPGSSTTALSTSADSDPFASPAPAPAAPAATLEDVRKALTALREASTQEKALVVLKSAGGADNITALAPDKYGTVVAAVNVQLRILEAAKPAPVVEADPFSFPAEGVETSTKFGKALTVDDVRAEVIASSKRTSQDTVAKVVMDAGGKAAGPDGIFKPSWKALPESKYGEVIAALKALPTTK